MPTEADFLAAARVFDDAAHSLDRAAAGLGASISHEVVVGGRLRTDLDEFTATAASACASDSTGLADLAATCRWRADVVGAYRNALEAYRADYRRYVWERDRWLLDPSGPLPLEPTEPARPAAWVEL